MDWWLPVEALGVVATAGIAAWTAFLAKSAAEKSNAAATTLAEIESQRRRSELCPRLRVSCEPFNPGSDIIRLRVALAGPFGLDHLDRLTVAIRNDHFTRGDGYQERMGGPTKEQIKAHIWGPYHFTPRTGPDEARADSLGRSTVYDAELPTGEELIFQLEHTLSGSWMSMTQPDWLRQQGTVIRLAFTAEREPYEPWYLPCEIDTASLPVTVYVPQVPDGGSAA